MGPKDPQTEKIDILLLNLDIENFSSKSEQWFESFRDTRRQTDKFPTCEIVELKIKPQKGGTCIPIETRVGILKEKYLLRYVREVNLFWE